jgi:regulator of sigma E protease
MVHVVVAILGLGLLIVLHEGGHFLVARLCGMRVERFSIGFGPTLIGFKRGGTLFQIAPIPLGGFVQITGMNPHDEIDRTDPYVYPNRPTWMRLATIVAGPAANYLTAVVIALVVILGYGMRSKQMRIIEPLAGKPAAVAGLAADDVLVEANGHPVSFEAPISDVIRAGQGAPVTIKVLRKGQPMTFTVTPEKVASGAYQIGVQLGGTNDREKASVAMAVKEATVYPYYATIGILGSLYDMIRGRISAELSGPIGIVNQMSKASKRGAADFLELIASLSVYLGLFNLLPFPALDGGRAVFLAVESITRRRVNPRLEATVHTVGLVFLLGVLVLVTFKDIFRRG